MLVCVVTRTGTVTVCDTDYSHNNYYESWWYVLLTLYQPLYIEDYGDIAVSLGHYGIVSTLTHTICASILAWYTGMEMVARHASDILCVRQCHDAKLYTAVCASPSYWRQACRALI